MTARQKTKFKIQERYGPDKKPNEPSFTLAEKGAMVNRAVWVVGVVPKLVSITGFQSTTPTDERRGWDNKILAIELQNLMTIDSNLDVTITGFEIAEIDLILSQEAVGPSQDDVLGEQPNEIVTQRGDLWVLGKHRILCGNALDENSYKMLMASRRANVVFIDPPYNVAIEGNVSGHGSIHHPEFAMASGEMNEAEWV